EVYYTDGGPREASNRLLASSLLDAMLSQLRDAGFDATSRGIRSDLYQRYSAEETRNLILHNANVVHANGYDPANCRECMRLLTTGNNPMSVRMGNYTSALVEVEFISNPDVVETLIMRPD